MQRDVIAREFVKLFREQAELRIERIRPARTGRIDPRRAARVVNGDGRIFASSRLVAGAQTAGSFALCVALQDVYSYFHPHDDDGREQARLWAEAVRTLFDAATRAGIPARIFAANADPSPLWGWGADAPTVLKTFGSVDALLRQKHAINSWMRQKETIVRAEQWHRSVNARGRRITLLVTMWPEMRSSTENTDPERYRQALAAVAEETARWTRGSHFYALGVQLEKTSRATWGEYQRYGVHNHFRACFPTASRYEINEPDDLALALRALAQRMAKLQR